MLYIVGASMTIVYCNQVQANFIDFVKSSHFQFAFIQVPVMSMERKYVVLVIFIKKIIILDRKLIHFNFFETLKVKTVCIAVKEVCFLFTKLHIFCLLHRRVPLGEITQT